MINTFFGTKSVQFMDPVHGGIGALRHEIMCVDHALFQRLRFILQNDVAHYVFPGATQTRFNHSIGVMHVAGKFYRSLIDQYIAECSPDFAISSEHTEAIYYVYCCFRLAALLHDTGHFPFSHEFESSPPVHSILTSKDLLKDFWAESELYNKYAGARLGDPNFALDHADYSLACAYRILESNKNSLPVAIDDVLALMENNSATFTNRWESSCVYLAEILEGRSDSLTNLPPKARAEKLRSFFALMISGEIDVDKMDYLLRDSYFSGTKYGIYNQDHLLSTLRVGYNPNTGWVGLAVLEKGAVALEDFVYSRFQIYQNVWSHKAVVGAKIRLADAISESMSKPDAQTHVNNALRKVSAFAQFTDHFFMEEFRKHAAANEDSASNALLSRKKLHFLTRLQDPSADEIEETLVKLQREHKTAKVVYRSVHIKFSKIPQRDFSQIKVLCRGPDRKRELRVMDQRSDFFEKFTEKVICNFYAKQ